MSADRPRVSALGALLPAGGKTPRALREGSGGRAGNEVAQTKGQFRGQAPFVSHLAEEKVSPVTEKPTG